MKAADDPLSLVFRALADPTRRALIERLAAGEVSVGELAAPFDVSGPAISQHLRVLEGAGLISRTKRAQWRLCALTPAPLDEATAWVARNRQLWSERFDTLDGVLAALQDTSQHPAPRSAAPPRTSGETP